MSRKIMHVLLAAAMLIVWLAGCSDSTNESGNKNGNSQLSSNAPSSNPDTKDNAEAGREEDQSNRYGDTGGITLPIVDKPVTISMLVSSDAQNLNDKWVVKELENRTGIKVNMQAYSTATYRDKLKVILASGNLPDIMHGLSLAQINELGGKGVFAAVNDYLEVLPNFRKLYVDDPEQSWVMKSFSDDKGKIYTWPLYGLSREVNHGFLYRKDIFDKHGIKLWSNTEEFYQALKTLKEHYPDSYPYASKTTAWIFRDWAYGWGVVGSKYPAFYDESSGAWKLTYTQPEYKDMLDFMKKLYREGLLDPEFITDTSANWTAKMTTNNSAFVTFDWIGRLDMFYNQVKQQNPDYDLRYGNPVGPSNQIRSLPMVESFGHVVRKNDKSEIALKLLDYLSSPSGAELMTKGAEGEIYALDENGNATYPKLTDVDLVDIKVLEENYGMWVQGSYVRTDRSSVYYNFTEKEQEAQDMMKNMRATLDPELKFSDEETSTIADLAQSLQKAGEEFSAKYILTDSYGDAEWDAWLKKAGSLGEQDYIAAYNSAQKRFDSE